MPTPESTAVWTEEQVTEDEYDILGDSEDDKWSYTNWKDDE